MELLKIMNKLIELGRATVESYEFAQQLKQDQKRYPVSAALTSPVTQATAAGTLGGMAGLAKSKRGAAIGALAGGALGYGVGRLRNKINRRGEIDRANRRKAKGLKQKSELRGARYK